MLWKTAGIQKLAVVAEGAAEVAASEKNGGCYQTREVQKRCFLQTGNNHEKAPFRETDCRFLYYNIFLAAWQRGAV